MRRMLTAIVVVAAIGGTAARAADPSDSCSGGLVPASTTPAGAGTKIATEPLAASVTACNDGAVVPAPGAARVSADATDGTAVLVVDGDPGNAVTPCSDGYLAVGAGSDGVKLYESGDGGFTSRARAKSPDQLAKDLVVHCVPAA